MIIKGLLKALTDNSLVRVEKIGSGNYYWAFTSDSKATRSNRINTLTEKADTLSREIDHFNEEIDKARLQREALV